MEVSLLEVPYISQLDDQGALRYHNDCGAACGVMLLETFMHSSNITVDEFFTETGVGADKYLSVGQIMNVLARHGLNTVWKTGMSLLDLFEQLAAGNPVMVLFNYKVLRKFVSLTSTMFSGAHFGVIVGIDTHYVYLHDPLWMGEGGKALPIAHADWMEIWDAAVNDGNPACGGLIPCYVPDHTGYQYTMRVAAPDGLRVRSTPQVASGNDTGKRIAYNKTVRVYSEAFDDAGNLWVAITLDRSSWVAAAYQGQTYMIEVV